MKQPDIGDALQAGDLDSDLAATPLRTLRRIYGRWFAPGMADDKALAEALGTLDRYSKADVAHDLQLGLLRHKIVVAQSLASFR
ncbi:MAG TPA: hypothetical protein VG248_10890 [Caulobacteraceae bacterium]|nr:hypothetical protein [Caulobacteraceae bacterium]